MIDVAHFAASTEAYVLADYRIITPVMLQFCSWAGDLASAAGNLDPGMTNQQQVNESAEAWVCKKGNFNPSDVTCDADGWKVAQMIIQRIDKGSKHAVSEAIEVYYNSSQITRRIHHMINDMGILDSDNASYEMIKEKIQITMSAPVLWDRLGYLSDGKTLAPAIYRYALIHAFAKYCYENK